MPITGNASRIFYTPSRTNEYLIDNGNGGNKYLALTQPTSLVQSAGKTTVSHKRGTQITITSQRKRQNTAVSIQDRIVQRQCGDCNTNL